MCDPDSVFMKALAAFKTRTLYSNIINDRTAVYYTTSISPIDPFTNLDAVKINYLPDFSPVLVDAANPVSPVPLQPENGWLTSDMRSILLRLRMGLFFAIFIPIGSILYLLNAAVQSVLSGQRIKAHVAGFSARAYEVPLVMERMRETVEGIRERAEEVFERVNADHKQQYLIDDDTGDHADERITLNNRPLDVDSFTTVGKMEFPTLALAPSQFHMIKELNAIGWTKYPVHINRVSHSHAAIIVRMNRDSFSEGRLVIGHFLDNFQV
jgi:hypothetical protein